MLRSTLFVLASNWKQPKCSVVGEGMSKVLVYSHNGMLYGNENKCYNMSPGKEERQEEIVEPKGKRRGSRRRSRYHFFYAKFKN